MGVRWYGNGKTGAGRLVLALLLLGAVGCAELQGIVNEPLRRRVVDGEIRSVDARAARIQLREARGGNVTVRYDRATRVFDGQREYPPTALERGDLVRVWVSQDRAGTAWADRVEVVRGRQPEARVERLEGTVGRVEPGRGYFTVVRGREAVYVYVPPSVRREDVRRLERLRAGDRVRLDVRATGRDEAELVRFR